MTQLNLHHMQNDQSNNDSVNDGYMDHQQMKNQYDTLFRNLQSLSRTSRLSQFRHQNQTNEQKRIEDIQTMKSRYFNLRIEFNTSSNHSLLPTADISNERISCLPLAIDPGTDLNSFFDTATQLNFEDARNCVPSIIRSIDEKTNVQLGSIVEKNVTGIGVKVVSFQHHDETDIPEIGTTHKKKLKQSRTSDDEQNPVTPYVVLENQSNAYAIPKYKKLNKNHEQIFLPCIIKDHRIRKKTNLDYKVLFFDPHLDELKIKKQWISSNKVVSTEYMKQQLHSFLNDSNLETLQLNQCCESEVAHRLAFDLRLPVHILKRQFKDELRLYVNSLQLKLTYAYAKEPVSFIV